TMSVAVLPLRRPFDSDRLLLALCLGVPLVALTIFFFYPLIIVVIRSGTQPDGHIGLENSARVLASRGFWTATGHSLTMSLATTFLALLLGLVVASAVHRCRVPGRALLIAVVSLPLLAPSLVQGLGLIFLLGRNGILTKATGLDIN